MGPQPAYAATYEQARHGYSPEAIAHVKRRVGISASSIVLDLACGTGLVLREFLAEAREVYGLDVSAEMLAEARRCCPAAPLARGRGEALPFRAAAFDLVTLGQSVHHFDLERLVPELYRVLRPGGWLAVVSKYPSPREPWRPLMEHTRDRLFPRKRFALTQATSMGNVLGLERCGFTDYERAVFQWEVEYSARIWLDGLMSSGETASLGAGQQSLFGAELERALARLAPTGLMRETYLDTVITARRSDLTAFRPRR